MIPGEFAQEHGCESAKLSNSWPDVVHHFNSSNCRFHFILDRPTIKMYTGNSFHQKLYGKLMSTYLQLRVIAQDIAHKFPIRAKIMHKDKNCLKVNHRCKTKVPIWSLQTAEIRELFHPTQSNIPSSGF